jgi:hypothetical protein
MKPRLSTCGHLIRWSRAVGIVEEWDENADLYRLESKAQYIIAALLTVDYQLAAGLVMHMSDP